MKNIFFLVISLMLTLLCCRTAPQERWQMFTGYKIGAYTNTIVVGSTYGDYAGGYVTFFEYKDNDWEQTALFDLTLLAKGYRGPVSIQVNDRHAVIGLDGKRGTPGAILLLHKENGRWQPGSLFQAPDKEADDMFGFVTSLTRDTLAVGVRRKDSGRGSVYIYNISSTQPFLVQKITNNDGEEIEGFGSSVHLYVNLLAVGASGYNYEKNKTAEPKLPRGKIILYSFTDGTWKEFQTLYDFEGHQRNFYLGEKVFVDNEKLITYDFTDIFSFTRNSEGNFDYPIKFNTNESSVLHMACSENWLVFRFSTGTSTNTAVSRVSLFNYNGTEWNLQKEFLHTDFNGGTRLYFGQEIALHGNVLLITDPGNSPGFMDVSTATPAPGKVHIIRLAEDGTYEYEGMIIRWYDDENKLFFGVIQPDEKNSE